MKSRTKSRPIENLVLSDDRVREKKPATHRSELQISTFINCFLSVKSWMKAEKMFVDRLDVQKKHSGTLHQTSSQEAAV